MWWCIARGVSPTPAKNPKNFRGRAVSLTRAVAGPPPRGRGTALAGARDCFDAPVAAVGRCVQGRKVRRDRAEGNDTGRGTGWRTARGGGCRGDRWHTARPTRRGGSIRLAGRRTPHDPPAAPKGAWRYARDRTARGYHRPAHTSPVLAGAPPHNARKRPTLSREMVYAQVYVNNNETIKNAAISMHYGALLVEGVGFEPT
jgi:hypothetical protein